MVWQITFDEKFNVDGAQRHQLHISHRSKFKSLVWIARERDICYNDLVLDIPIYFRALHVVHVIISNTILSTKPPLLKVVIARSTNVEHTYIN